MLFRSPQWNLFGNIIEFEGDWRDACAGTGYTPIDKTDNTEIIFDFKGIRTISSLLDLPTGTYIVNGKKIIKK